ncbi:hypothetical protein CCMSSC00406_0005517 [Pleurotus cornucopiae]|uniref:Uncharacterized protein n=1 Tax=Pleurotus cornucopiae TaxID=5321 RepID=A0ACB7ITK0_PLECO|nr:hypothetical protein CCMSSC00406_0005517 [Pleurotus cornucopiae]
MSNAGSPSPSPPPNPPPILPEDPITARAKACEELVLACVEGKFSLADLVDKLETAGATPAEAEDFIQQAQQSLAALANLREATPVGLSDEEAAAFRRTRDTADSTAHNLGQQRAQEAVNVLSWNLLRAKVASASSLVDPSSHSKLLSGYAKQLADLIGAPSSSQQNGAIPSSVLDAAPHLAKLVSDTSDPLLEATWKLREAYATDKAIDSIIDLLQRQHMHEPIARSIWRDIIQDKYVNFEKLYASILPGYDHRDEAKEFISGYAIIKKDNVNVRRPLSDEADWLRVFGAWEAAVIMVYPHRKDELVSYHRYISDLFHAIPSPLITIRFDAEVRERYARSPFRLDDRSKMDMPLYVQIFRGSPLAAAKNKRPLGANSPTSPQKRTFVGMGFALNAGTSTGPGMQTNASPPYKQVVSELEEVRTRVAEAQAGPRRFETEKRKGEPLDPLRYRRFTWSSNKSNNTSPSASYTEFAPPLPSPPEHLVKDPSIAHAIILAGDRIRVDTPFDIDKIERQLSDHPNQPFVQSVIRGLREGFWPLDEGDWKPNDPVDIENYATSEKDLEVIRNSRDKEVALGRWSEGFDSLEEGMVVSPLFVVWQHGKGRLVIDQSASGLNDGIPREEAKVSYDDMRPFGQCLHDARNDYPHRKLVLFKSDVASAFLNLPAHPIWQLRQVVKVDNKYHIVRRLVIGSRASPRIWCAVSSLLCWLAIEKLGIIGLHVYMDDFFGWDFAGNLVYFHGSLRPKKQVQLLLFWDAIKCPYEDRKQEHGSPLKIIGFWVDIVEGSISLHQSSIDDIVSKINTFLAMPKRRPSLKDFQHLGGHLNWLLNVLPWGKPATFELYKKTSGKSISHAGITINKSITEELTWLRDIIPRAVGIRFVDSLRWEDDEADLVMAWFHL